MRMTAERGVVSSAHGIRMKNSVHSGGFVTHEIVEALELSVTGATRALGGTRAGETEVALLEPKACGREPRALSRAESQPAFLASRGRFYYCPV